MITYSKWRIFFLALSLSMPAAGDAIADVDFQRLNGSDLGMGVGARAMGMSGAFVSVADDVSATYWNPAGLPRLNQSQFFVSADPLEEISAVILAYRSKLSLLQRYKFVVGLGYINRLSFQGDSGNDTWGGYEYHLLDMAMIDVGEDYSGSVDSRTYDIRLSLAVRPPQFTDFSIGITLANIS